MTGAHLLLVAIAFVAVWRLTKSQDRRPGSQTPDVSPRELLAVLPTAALAAVIAGISVAAFLLLLAPAPR